MLLNFYKREKKMLFLLSGENKYSHCCRTVRSLVGFYPFLFLHCGCDREQGLCPQSSCHTRLLQCSSAPTLVVSEITHGDGGGARD